MRARRPARGGRARSGPASALAALLAAAVWASPAAAQEETRTTLDGIYTAEQAQEGKQVYVRVCSQCHPLDWYQGDIMRAWEGAPIYNFYQVVSTTMPQSNPGSLPRSDYVDMLAYILELNGMPPGEESLSSRSSTLRNIVFQWSDTR